MDYKQRFIAAVNKTRELGLPIEGSPLPIKKKQLSERKISKVHIVCSSHLKAAGYHNSRDLNTKCFGVHALVQFVMKDMLNIDSHITIGSMHGHGWDYCPMTYNKIKEEISNPDVNQVLEAHAWLTLPDGAVIDWTGQAWRDTHADNIHDSADCMLYLAPGKFREDHYYKPYLVGMEYLYRTDAMPRPD